MRISNPPRTFQRARLRLVDASSNVLHEYLVTGEIWDIDEKTRQGYLGEPSNRVALVHIAQRGTFTLRPGDSNLQARLQAQGTATIKILLDVRFGQDPSQTLKLTNLEFAQSRVSFRVEEQ